MPQTLPRRLRVSLLYSLVMKGLLVPHTPSLQLEHGKAPQPCDPIFDHGKAKMCQQRLKVVGRVEIVTWLPKGFASELSDGVIVRTAEPQLLPYGQRGFYV